jgi:adenine-specific DNA-methyltransferase
MRTLGGIGKQAVLNHHNDMPYHQLNCSPELSFGKDGGGNLLIPCFSSIRRL